VFREVATAVICILLFLGYKNVAIAGRIRIGD
jgi:hypothetical protein